jgi:hypothetical protein
MTHVYEPARTVTKVLNRTEKRTRTSTELPPLAPEASVSTNSTTSAIKAKVLNFFLIVNFFFKVAVFS